MCAALSAHLQAAKWPEDEVTAAASIPYLDIDAAAETATKVNPAAAAGKPRVWLSMEPPYSVASGTCYGVKYLAASASSSEREVRDVAAVLKAESEGRVTIGELSDGGVKKLAYIYNRRYAVYVEQVRGSRGGRGLRWHEVV